MNTMRKVFARPPIRIHSGADNLYFLRRSVVGLTNGGSSGKSTLAAGGCVVVVVVVLVVPVVGGTVVVLVVVVVVVEVVVVVVGGDVDDVWVTSETVDGGESIVESVLGLFVLVEASSIAAAGSCGGS